MHGDEASQAPVTTDDVVGKAHMVVDGILARAQVDELAGAAAVKRS